MTLGLGATGGGAFPMPASPLLSSSPASSKVSSGGGWPYLCRVDLSSRFCTIHNNSGLGECFLTSGTLNIGLGLPPRRRESFNIPVRPNGPGTGVGATASG